MKKKIMAVFVALIMCMSLCNLLPVEAEESASISSYSTGVIPETAEEYAQHCGAEIIDLSVESEIATASVSTLPSRVDLSTDPAFPPIGAQGKIGSCVAWATTYYQFTYQANKLRNIASDSAENIYSPTWTYNYTNAGRDGGSMIGYAHEVLKKQGAMKLSDLPYDGTEEGYSLAWPNDIKKMTEALECRAFKTRCYTNFDATSLTEIKEELANGYVGVISTNTALLWVIKEAANGEKIIVCGAGGGGGHAMTVVGYDDNIQVTVNGVTLTGAFKLANSRGENWGNNGYIWVSYDALNSDSAYGESWQENLITENGSEYKISARYPFFGSFSINQIYFTDAIECEVSFAGYVEYTTVDPFDVIVKASYGTSASSVKWNYMPEGFQDEVTESLSVPENRILVYDYFNVTSSTYVGNNIVLDYYLSTQWTTQINDESGASDTTRMRTKIIDNLGNVVAPTSSEYTNLQNATASKTISIDLAKGRVTAYDNGPITSEDSAMVLDYTIEAVEFSNIQKCLADYNSDGVISTLDVIEMNQAIAAQSGQSYAITDYIEEWGCSLADVIEEQYDMPIEQYVAENYAELSALDVIPAELEVM